MLYKFLKLQTKSISGAALILITMTLLSRFFGLLRDRLLAGKFGAGSELDIYFAAFRVPDFIYGIFIMGGISAVFLPIFSELRARDENYSWQFVNNVLMVLLIGLSIICLILALTTPLFIKFIVPGFSKQDTELAISLTRIMFLSPILLGISAIFSGILQYFHRFLAYSTAPVLYNLGIIFGILFFVDRFGLLGLAMGVILGAFLHMVIQAVVAVSSGWKVKDLFKLYNLNLKDYALKKMLNLTVPRIFGASAYYINLIVITAIASTLGAGAIAVFNFSNNLQYLPIGLIGVSLAVAVFPILSRAWAVKDKTAFINNFSMVFRQILFITIPISLLMILLRAHIVRVVLGTGQFGWQDTRLVAASLALFAIGIIASSSAPLFTRALFALHNTKIPAVISLFSVAVNIIMAIWLVNLLSFAGPFRYFWGKLLKVSDIENISVLGLPLAVSIATILQALLLFYAIHRKINLPLQEIFKNVFKMIISATALVGTVYVLLRFGAGIGLNLQTFGGIFIQGALAGVGGIIAYFFVSVWLNLSEAKTMHKFLTKFLRQINNYK